MLGRALKAVLQQTLPAAPQLSVVVAQHATRQAGCSTALSTAMSSSSDEHPPQPPGMEECCQSGCRVCVWDVYMADLKEWQHKHSPEPHEDNHDERKTQLMDHAAAKTGPIGPVGMDAFHKMEAQLAEKEKQRRQATA